MYGRLASLPMDVITIAESRDELRFAASSSERTHCFALGKILHFSKSMLASPEACEKTTRVCNQYTAL